MPFLHKPLTSQQAHFEQLVDDFKVDELVPKLILEHHVLRHLMKSYSLLGVL